jgi:hypothetical protein
LRFSAIKKEVVLREAISQYLTYKHFRTNLMESKFALAAQIKQICYDSIQLRMKQEKEVKKGNACHIRPKRL